MERIAQLIWVGQVRVSLFVRVILEQRLKGGKGYGLSDTLGEKTSGQMNSPKEEAHTLCVYNRVR